MKCSIEFQGQGGSFKCVPLLFAGAEVILIEETGTGLPLETRQSITSMWKVPLPLLEHY